MSTTIEKIETTAYFTWMGEDGIARTEVKPGSEVTIREAKENSDAVLSLSDGIFPLLIDARQIKSITKEAREHFSVNNRVTKITSMAILVESPLSRVVGNFFIGLNKPRIPSKLFGNEKVAVEWLKQFK